MLLCSYPSPTSYTDLATYEGLSGLSCTFTYHPRPLCLRTYFSYLEYTYIDYLLTSRPYTESTGSVSAAATTQEWSQGTMKSQVSEILAWHWRSATSRALRLVPRVAPDDFSFSISPTAQPLSASAELTSSTEYSYDASRTYLLSK